MTTELQQIAIEAKDRQEKAQFRRAVDTAWIDSRMAGARMNRCLARIQQEANMEKDYQEKTDHAAIVNARADRETALAREIEEEKRRTATEASRRQLARQNDPELLELANKLRAGFVCRDRLRQIADNEHRRLQDKIEQQYNNCVMQKSVCSDAEALLAEEKDQMERKVLYKGELWRQMCGVETQRQKQLQEKIAEKKIMDEMLKTFHDQDMCELQLKRERMRELQCEMVTSLRERAEWREQRRRLAEEQEQRVRREAQEIESRQSGVEAERERKFKIKEEINRKVALKVLAQQEERKVRTDLTMELQEQEYLERNVQLDAAEKQKEESVKESNKTELTQQMESKRAERRREQEAGIAYRNEMAKKMAAEEQKEQDKQRLRKEKMLKYSVELMQQIAADRERKDLEKRDNDARNSGVFGTDTKWREEVQKEREKLISEHAPHVLGYLQPGVLKPEDIPALKAGALRHEHLSGLDLGALAGGRQERFSKCNAQCRKIRNY